MRRTGLFAATVAVATLISLGPAAADDAATINACLKKEHDAARSGRDCIGRISDPCLRQPGHESTTGMVECVDTETKVWDDLLNADYQRLLGARGQEHTADRVLQLRTWYEMAHLE